MIGRMMNLRAKDMAMDLGTANTLIYVKGKGVVIDQPSMVAVDRNSNQVVAVGEEARRLTGRQENRIAIRRPLRDGVIQDFESAGHMIRHFLEMVFKRFPLSRPKLVVAIPTGITTVEKSAVIEAAQVVGAGKIYLMEEPMAAAIGTGLAIEQAMGHMVVDIGGGTTDVAVISKFAVACSESLRVAGDEANEAVRNHILNEHRIRISEEMAEDIKIKIGTAVPLKKGLQLKLRGKDVSTGLPKLVAVTDSEVRAALKEPTRMIVQTVNRVLEKASPELVSDVVKNGIYLAGGGALLKGLPQLIQKATGIEAKVSEDPLRSVIRGAGATTEHFDYYREVFVN